MHTKKIYSSLARTGTRLAILAAMLIAFIGNVAGVSAAPPRNIQTVTVGAQSGTLTYGTTGDVTFLVSVRRGTPNNFVPSNFSLSVTGLPVGATAVIPAPNSFAFSPNPRIVTLTIHSNGNVAVGSTSFTVQANGNPSNPGPSQIGSGTLTIAQASQTITFAALPSKTFGDADFSVSATGGASGNPATFTASGNCSVIGTLVHLTAVGSCTITAHQAGNTNYSAAPDVARTFAINAPAGPTVALDLYAVTGSTTLPGGLSVPVWGYNTTNTPVTKPGGPVLIVNQNDNVVITLHNQLTGNSALLFQGQSMIPDTSGAGAGLTKNYSFIASKPGTFLYEAGLIPGSQHQTAMGLYGALIVRPAAPGQAYDTAVSAFDSEQVLVLSELDTVLNSSANPAAFDMRTYNPRYFLINGKAYPSTDPISVGAGKKVLLRYVDAGLQAHSMSTLGVSQTIIAQDGNAYALGRSAIAETIAPGQTLDTIVSIPSSAVVGNQFALYDASLYLRNNTGKGVYAGMGGMLTTLTVGTGGTTPPGDTTGPVASSLSLSPNPTNGAGNVTVSATISDVTTGNANIDQAEFYIDSTASLPTAMTGTFGSPSVAVTGTIPVATLAGLSSGNHTIYIRGHDAALPSGNWGAFLAITLNLDKSGPSTSGLTLSPNPNSGAVNVVLSATGDDSASGNSNITAAEYTVDGVGPAIPMAIVAGAAAPIRNFTATIPAGLAQGTHVVSVRSQDSFGNWGTPSTIDLVVSDLVPPTTVSVSASPNPNNGSTPFNTSVLAIRVFASFSDALSGNSNLANAEGFLEVAGTTGTGFVFIANDGNFDSPAESGYADIPLPVVATLSQGTHPICVHAKDAAGNWGTVDCSYNLVIDTLPPTVSAATLTPSVTNNAAVLVSATANDTASGNSNIGGGEYFIDTLGVAGTGTVMTPAAASPNTTINATIPGATIGALSNGNHTVYVRAKDAAGNWSTTTANATLLVDHTAPTFSSITLTPSSIAVGTATVGLTVNGASDGTGSGVAGGEYWICPLICTNPATGSGTSFTGLSVSIPTNLLAGGQQYTVRARIRDVAGNWSTGGNGIRSAVLTVTTANNIFTDGFESGTLPGSWTSRSTTTATRLNATTGSTLFGAFGLQAQGGTGNTDYVQYNLGTAAATYDARFYFNPNNDASAGHDIFAGADSSAFTTQLFHVRYRRNGAQPQVQIQVGATANASWVNITNNTRNTIEVVWQSNGTLALYVNGAITASQSLSTGVGSVGAVRLGAVTSSNNTINQFFDAFASKSTASPLIGP